MRLVVDTNIVFSAVLNANSRIARILIAGRRHFTCFSCAFLRTELSKHRLEREVRPWSERTGT